MAAKDAEIYYAESKHHWRQWLVKNHIEKEAVWLVMYKQSAKIPTISWSDAVDEALCFGWIDSLKKKLNEDSSIQFYCKRKAKSTWSKINKQKVEKLIEAGLMQQAGLKCIEIAKQNGSWEILDSVEELLIPDDLESKLRSKNQTFDFFISLSKSTKKAILQWLVLTKRQETRQNRINEIVELAAKNMKPKQF